MYCLLPYIQVLFTLCTWTNKHGTIHMFHPYLYIHIQRIGRSTSSIHTYTSSTCTNLSTLLILHTCTFMYTTYQKQAPKTAPFLTEAAQHVTLNWAQTFPAKCSVRTYEQKKRQSDTTISPKSLTHALLKLQHPTHKMEELLLPLGTFTLISGNILH